MTRGLKVYSFAQGKPGIPIVTLIDPMTRGLKVQHGRPHARKTILLH